MSDDNTMDRRDDRPGDDGDRPQRRGRLSGPSVVQLPNRIGEAGPVRGGRGPSRRRWAARSMLPAVGLAGPGGPCPALAEGDALRADRPRPPGRGTRTEAGLGRGCPLTLPSRVTIAGGRPDPLAYSALMLTPEPCMTWRRSGAGRSRRGNGAVLPPGGLPLPYPCRPSAP